MKVYALIGPTGTGKSYRAPHIAQQHGIDCIIDDGLLISQQRIVAGRSSKAELSKIKAAKVALFYYPSHREEVKKALLELNPRRIMVLGISLPMVEKICERLEIPTPEEIFEIYDLASTKEIELALQARENEGKHTIPVPLVEIKRNLWGDLVDRIPVVVWRWFYSSHEKTVVRPPFSYLGKLIITENALRSLIALLLSYLPWIEKVETVEIRRASRGIEIELECVFREGFPIAQFGRIVQGYLREKVEYLTGVEINIIHVNVSGIAGLSLTSAALSGSKYEI
ncbi:MAG: isopentenyl transferase family protein [Candidatus Caldatribacteriaceae bacterium]